MNDEVTELYDSYDINVNTLKKGAPDFSDLNSVRYYSWEISLSRVLISLGKTQVNGASDVRC